MMTEAEKQAIRDAKAAGGARLEKAFAPLFLGQQCPILGKECVGPACMNFLRQVEGDKVVNGNCAFNIIAMNIAPIGVGLMEIAERTAGQQSGQLQRLIVPQGSQQ